MNQLFTYVPESADLIRSREIEVAFSWQTVREASAEQLDLSKDWNDPITGRRFGVCESFSDLYDAPRPA